MMMISFSQVIYLLLFVFDRCSFGAAVDTCVDPEVFVVAIWNNFILFITTGKLLFGQCTERFLQMNLV